MMERIYFWKKAGVENDENNIFFEKRKKNQEKEV